MLKLAGELLEEQLADHIARLDAHMRSKYQLMRTGEYIVPLSVSRGEFYNMTLSANLLMAQPFFVARAITVDRIAIYIQTAVDPSNIRLGIYNDGTNLYPETLLLDAGIVSGATTGLKAITINPAQALSKGVYWLVVVSDAAPTVYGHYSQNWTPLGWQTTLYDRQAKWGVAFTYAALPDPFPAGASLTWGAPNISCRLAALA